MKRFLFLIFLIVLAGYFTFNFAKEKVKNDLTRPVPYPTITITPVVKVPRTNNGPTVTSLFVPYWTMKEKLTGRESYNTYIYFGVTPNSDGIDMKEQGAVSLNNFLAFVPKGKKKLLAVRMIDRETNFDILKDQAKQRAVINQTIALAKNKKFDGLVLDLEVTAIPFDSLIKQITTFNESFYTDAKKNHLSFSVAIYGDVFYRVRPFDVKNLAKNADTIMIMAYDFSKAKGNPGPNFPLQGEDQYGYDYEKMTKDFLSVVPAHKLTVVFGLFGYDWVVDAKGQTLQTGNAVSSQEIEDKFIEMCRERSCSFSRDEKAFETQVNYVAKDGNKHIIWFEDTQSVDAKKEFLKSQGINSFSYWAHSYF
jgi:spore germination protein YaaH